MRDHGVISASDFSANPILNSPFEEPDRHWFLDDRGIPSGDITAGRRPSRYLIPIPAARRRRRDVSGELFAGTEAESAENALINDIRREVQKWRKLPDEKKNISRVTECLLRHWREGETTPRLFFCQVEAAETLIWLNEVAPKTTVGKKILQAIKEANDEANPPLFRLAAKMATGSGKTTVMAMLIAYHTVNKSRKPSSKIFASHFLIITPGITIKDRLRVLLPHDSENYYERRGIVPFDMLPDMEKAHVVITNYHALKLQETQKITKKTRRILESGGESFSTCETPGQMLRRVCPELLRAKDAIVINDEAHHCYRRKTEIRGAEQEEKIISDEKEDVERNNEAARLWISGIEALYRSVNVQMVYDLSATPFFLRGSGYPEGRLFPWAVSDFSLMDALEAGIAKLPRVPVEDAGEENLPIYRNIYAHVSRDLPRQSRATQANMDPQELPAILQAALMALYGNYKRRSEAWEKAGVEIPPVFIIICNNTSTSKLVYDYVSGYKIKGRWREGEFPLFNNVGEDGKPLARPRTLLIDSYQLESGDTLSKDFKQAAAQEIALFKEETRRRYPERDIDKITDEELLREVMNTVGREKRLGEQVRCIVSVSMLTEGWDANNVTHILGVRKFGTQLLCEQVVGRGLRRLNYTLEEGEDKFPPEYADVFGVPFHFQGRGEADPAPPKPQVRVRHLDERAELAIFYPRVRGYKVVPPETSIVANFTPDSRLKLTVENAPAITEQSAIIGEQEEMTLDELKERRINEVIFKVASYTALRHFGDGKGGVVPRYFRDLVPIVRHWLRNYLDCLDGTFPQYLLLPPVARLAGERIYRACAPVESKERLLPVMDPFNPEGATFYVDFLTSRQRIHETQEDKSHINIAVCDSDWEMSFCRYLEENAGVFSYARNEGLGFEVPYLHDKKERRYRPDFVVLANDGSDNGNLLNLVVEIKGFRKGDAQAKADTMRRLWIPAINNDGRWGRWQFLEIMDMQDAKAKLAEYTGGKREKPRPARKRSKR